MNGLKVAAKAAVLLAITAILTLFLAPLATAQPAPPPDPIGAFLSQVQQAAEGLGIPVPPPSSPAAITPAPAAAPAIDEPIQLDNPIIMDAAGDSYLANPGDDQGLMPTGSYKSGTTTVGPDGNSCFQSLSNIPKRVGANIGANLMDATCTAADTTHFEQSQYVGQPAQLSMLRSNAQITLLSIGGNPWFSPVINQMVKLFWFGGHAAIGPGDPIYDGAMTYYGATLRDELVALHQKIRLASPDTVLYQTNYPPILPSEQDGIGTCDTFASPASIRPLQQLLNQLNQTIAEAAAISGAVVIDLTAPDSAWRTHGRVDACSPDHPGAWNLRLRAPLDVSRITTYDDFLAAVQYGSFHTTPYGNELTTIDAERTIRFTQPYLFH